MKWKDLGCQSNFETPVEANTPKLKLVMSVPMILTFSLAKLRPITSYSKSIPGRQNFNHSEFMLERKVGKKLHQFLKSSFHGQPACHCPGVKMSSLSPISTSLQTKPWRDLHYFFVHHSMMICPGHPTKRRIQLMHPHKNTWKLVLYFKSWLDRHLRKSFGRKWKVLVSSWSHLNC